MPYVSGDVGDATPGLPDTWFTLTQTQYKIMEKWYRGDFEADFEVERDWPYIHSLDKEIILEITPSGLDRASLEATAGGPFYPGIEGGFIFRFPKIYDEALRLNHSLLQPGDITKRMALPWQADFYACNTHWWPATRPDEVTSI